MIALKPKYSLRGTGRMRSHATCTLWRPQLLLTLLALLCVNDGQALAEDLSLSEERPGLIQNRKYRLEHEFTLGLGVLPTDAYYKGLSFAGGYTWHLDNLWGVGADFAYLQNFATNISEQLQDFGEPASKFAEIEYFGRVGGVFKPLYGKFSFLNDGQLHGELFLSASAVLARMNGGTPTAGEPLGKGGRFGFGAAPGFGLRAYINRYLSMRFDASWMFLTSAGELHMPLYLGLSLAITTRSDG